MEEKIPEEKKIPTHCPVCGKKLDVVDIFFHDGYCKKHEPKRTPDRRLPPERCDDPTWRVS